MVMYRLQRNIRPGGRYERYSSMVMHEVYGGEFTDYYIFGNADGSGLDVYMRDNVDRPTYRFWLYIIEGLAKFGWKFFLWACSMFGFMGTWQLTK